jgi:hypothetical protein
MAYTVFKGKGSMEMNYKINSNQTSAKWNFIEKEIIYEVFKERGYGNV